MEQTERMSQDTTTQETIGAQTTGHPMAAAYRDTVAAYLHRLGRCDVDGIVALFAHGARVFSPFLGWMAPRPFFERLREASGDSRIEPLDTLVSVTGAPRAIGYFVYHWGLKDGSQVRFDCCDVFDFAPDGRIATMTIVYDTHPIRADAGDKYG